MRNKEKIIIVWVDRFHAMILKRKGNENEVTRITAEERLHHTHRLDREDEHLHRFFRQIAKSLKPDEEFMLTGPGITLKHFRAYLEKNFNELSTYEIPCEPLTPAEAQWLRNLVN